MHNTFEFGRIYSCPSLLLFQLYPSWLQTPPDLSAQRTEEVWHLSSQSPKGKIKENTQEVR